MRTWPCSSGWNSSLAPVSVLWRRTATELVSRKRFMVDRGPQGRQRNVRIVMEHAHRPGKVVQTPTQPVELAQPLVAPVDEPQVAFARSKADRVPVHEHVAAGGADDVAAVRLAVRDNQRDVACIEIPDQLVEPVEPAPDQPSMGGERRIVEGELELAAHRHLRPDNSGEPSN